MTAVVVDVSENWMLAMEAIAAGLRNQNLEGIGREVEVQMEPLSEIQVRPGCYVTPKERMYERNLDTSDRDAIGYGCQITVIAGQGRPRDQSPRRVTRWQEIASRQFHKKRFWTPRTGDCLLPSRVSKSSAVEEREITKDKKVEVTSITVWAWVRETRS